MASEERFAPLKALLQRDGWTLVRIRGSHHMFSKNGRGLLVIPVHRDKVKAVYARQIRKEIEAD